ncbi:hypothetical protein BC940DRAFT_306609 [Gongronella butleri]|nr:hypothetical protein BC940DRAFT_306609 [Gongronella butleri]
MSQRSASDLGKRSSPEFINDTSEPPRKDNTMDDAAKLSNKDHRRVKKAKRNGQRYTVENGTLVTHPYLRVREMKVDVTLNQLRSLIMYLLDKTQKPPTQWIDVFQAEDIHRVVVVDVPTFDPTSMGLGSDQVTIAKDVAPDAYDALKRANDQFYALVGRPDLEDDRPAALACTSFDHRAGLVDRFSQLLQCKLSKAKSKQRRNPPVSDVNVLDLEDLLLTRGEMAIDNMPLHSSLDPLSPLPDNWVETGPGTGKPKRLMAVDCEMCKSGNVSVLVKVALVDQDGNVVLNELVQPSLPITDYVTRYSGVDASDLEGVTTTQEEIQEKLLTLIDGDVILVGHSIAMDLRALRLRHPHLIDTAFCYHHAQGPPAKPSLRYLATRFLQRAIQQGEDIEEDEEQGDGAANGKHKEHDVAKGHDPTEDALASLDLVRLKLKTSYEYGLHEDFVFETLMRRLDDQAHVRSLVIDASQLTYNPVLARQLDNASSYHAASTNDEAVHMLLAELKQKMPLDKAEHTEHTDNKQHTPPPPPPRLAMLKLGDIHSQPQAVAYLKQIHHALEPHSAMIIIAGNRANPDLDRLRKKWRDFKIMKRAQPLDAIPEDQQWCEQDELDLNEVAASAKRFFVFPLVKT